VNGGTKLQELPEIKNYALESAPNGQKGKVFHSGYAVVEKSYKSLGKTGGSPLRLGAFARVFFLISQSRKACLR